MKLLEDETAGLSEGEALSGKAAFKLYDTYGFPLDLTQDALRREGREVNTAEFDEAMEAQRAAARAAWSGSGDTADESVWFDLRAEHGATEFLGYIHDEADGVVQAIIKDSAVADIAVKGDAVEMVVNQSPFYAESGGQAGDAGEIRSSSGARIAITDVKKRAGALFSHIGKVVEGELKVGDEVHLSIDVARRARTRSNHSATHLMHAALRNVLGEHVMQKGSLVAEDRFRF